MQHPDEIKWPKADFSRILRDHPKFATAIQQVAKERFNLDVKTEALTAP